MSLLRGQYVTDALFLLLLASATIKLLLPLWLICLDIVKNYLEDWLDGFIPTEESIPEYIDILVDVVYGCVQVSLREKNIENPLCLVASLKPDEADKLADHIKEVSQIAKGK